MLLRSRKSKHVSEGSLKGPVFDLYLPFSFHPVLYVQLAFGFRVLSVVIFASGRWTASESAWEFGSEAPELSVTLLAPRVVTSYMLRQPHPRTTEKGNS